MKRNNIASLRAGLRRNLQYAVFLVLPGCAVLHHAQFGDIDTHHHLRPFDVMVSEVGVNTEEAGRVARGVMQSESARQTIRDVEAVIALFQQGPRTGNPVYVEGYAEKLIYEIYEKCPSGKITGVTSIRETRKYPVISGEIVKVSAYCVES